MVVDFALAVTICGIGALFRYISSARHTQTGNRQSSIHFPDKSGFPLRLNPIQTGSSLHYDRLVWVRLEEKALTPIKRLNN